VGRGQGGGGVALSGSLFGGEFSIVPDDNNLLARWVKALKSTYWQSRSIEIAGRNENPAQQPEGQIKVRNSAATTTSKWIALR
jgi:hypothetical protein